VRAKLIGIASLSAAAAAAAIIAAPDASAARRPALCQRAQRNFVPISGECTNTTRALGRACGRLVGVRTVDYTVYDLTAPRSALMVRSVASRSTLAWEIARVRVALASISVKTQASSVVRSMSMPSPTTAVVSDQPARNSYRASNRLGHTRNDPVRVDVAPLVLDQCGSRRLIRTPATAAAASTAAPSRIHPALASPRTLR
jgi:hypothetical protein